MHVYTDRILYGPPMGSIVSEIKSCNPGLSYRLRHRGNRLLPRLVLVSHLASLKTIATSSQHNNTNPTEHLSSSESRASVLSDGQDALAAGSLSQDDRTENGSGLAPEQQLNSVPWSRGTPSSTRSRTALSPTTSRSPAVSSLRSRGAIKVASLNMNGAHSRSARPDGSSSQDKWMLINQLMRQNRIAILALQETHYTQLQADRVNQIFTGLMQVHVSPDPDSPHAARGVAFALNLRIVRGDEVTVRELIPGRAMTLLLTRRRGTKMNVLNVYAPNTMDDNAAFWQQISAEVDKPGWPCPDVLLGDFNIVENARDRAPARADQDQAVRSLQALLTKLRLEDGWRARNGTTRSFSYLQTATGSQSRLDRVYVTGAILRMTHSWDIDPPGITTDHCMVSVAIADYNEPDRGPGRWRLPSVLLTDKLFLDEAQRLGMVAAGERYLGQPDKQAYAEQWRLHDFKRNVLSVAKTRVKQLTSKIDRRIAAIKVDIKKVLGSTTIPKKEREREAALLRDEEIRIAKRRFQSCKDAVMMRDRIDGETVSPYWMKLSKPSAMQEPIYELLRPGAPGDGPVYTRDSTSMASIAGEYYDGLQPDAGIDSGQHGDAIRDILSLDIPTLSQSQVLALQNDIQWNEIEAALLCSAPRKAPGVDGLPAEFWLKLHKAYQGKTKRGKPAFNVISLLKGAFNSVALKGVAPGSDFAKGWVCPIYKLKGDPRQACNYRPITVLNTDYKLMAKALAARLAVVAPTMIHEDQAGFVPGRRIFDHTRLAQVMIDYAELCEDEGALVALDQEKAYDKINHTYLWAVLRRMRFPEIFIMTVQRLYERAESLVFVNGRASPAYRIIRGVRQGDPVSCLLFDLAIEPLAIALRAAPLRGFTIPGVRCRIITALFADDTAVYLSAQDSYGTLLLVLERWCAASRARFNADKTELLPIGPKSYREKVLTTRCLNDGGVPIPLDVRIVPDGTAMRLLGAWVGNRVCQNSVWAPMLKKVEENLSSWDRRRPTLKGKRLIVGLEVGSRTQYLARVQGMPKTVEVAFLKVIRKFLWGKAATHPPIALKILYDPVQTGGLDMLDLEARNTAISMMWMKDYLNLSGARPRWTGVADVIFARAVTADSRNLDRDVRVNMFLQTWRVNAASSSKIPYYLLSMLKAANKFNVRFDAIDPSDELKDALPFWRHFALSDESRVIVSKSVKCLVAAHRVCDVGQASKVAARIHSIGEVRAHRPTMNCPCRECAEDREKGCDNPHRCAKAARKILEMLCPRWMKGPRRPADGLSLTANRKMTNRIHEGNDRRVLFDPSIQARMPLANHFRAFSSTEDRDSSVVRRPPRGISMSEEEVEVYTDGSCDKNGSADAIAAGGAWFGPDDARNVASLVPGEVQSNQTAELFAVSLAVNAVPQFAPLHIVTDSKYVFKGLIEFRRLWEAQGWIGVANTKLIRDTIARLRARSAPTSLRWIKGHSGSQGNDGADALAKNAVRTKSVVEMPRAPTKFVSEGAAMIAMTQKLAYKFVRRSDPSDGRETTRANVSRAREAMRELTKERVSEPMLWLAIWKMDVDRPVRAFWWKLMHGAHRVGKYWKHISGYEERAVCGFCGALESMEHILWTCGSPWRMALWAEVIELLTKRGIKVDQLEFGNVLAVGILVIPKDDGTTPPRADERLTRILLTEMLYMTWVLRCEWTIEREGDQDRMFTIPEVLNRWYWRINRRLKVDVLTARRAKKKDPTQKDVVLETWRGLLSCRGEEPEDWMSLSEVLVGRSGGAARRGVG